MKKYIADSKQIRHIMIDKDIKSITELSRLSGVSKPKIYEFLNGKTPLQSSFVRLAVFLSVDPNKLIIEEFDNE